MREPTIARNYAEALFEIAERSGEIETYGALIEAVAGAMEADERIRVALESPRVPRQVKQEILARALADKAPDRFVRFLAAVLKRGRQGLLPQISREYLALVDLKFNRVHAGITLAREPDSKLAAEIKRRLSRIVGKEVIPHYRADPRILGGIVVRIGDRVMDGSLRRKLLALKRQMLGAKIG
ncbi:MAG: ATP synthase subunit delta [Gemmatimonadales bacterium]|nr:ATP synthase subunit delta [bacterium HR33]GIW52603.1 MAG: ATP synthase subunit delta [Gemmatimonadales bacterium]